MLWVYQAATDMTCTGRPRGETPCPGAVTWVETTIAGVTGGAHCEPHHRNAEDSA